MNTKKFIEVGINARGGLITSKQLKLLRTKESSISNTTAKINNGDRLYQQPNITITINGKTSPTLAAA